MRRILFALAVMLWGDAALASPAPPVVSPLLTNFTVGVVCTPATTATHEAPGTVEGVVNDVDTVPKITVQGQQVPAVLGLSMAMTFDARTDLDNVSFRAWRPGNQAADRWTGSITASGPNYLGFSFENQNDLALGPWRFEAWSGVLLLFRTEFEVVAADALPGMAAACQATS